MTIKFNDVVQEIMEFNGIPLDAVEFNGKLVFSSDGSTTKEFLLGSAELAFPVPLGVTVIDYCIYSGGAGGGGGSRGEGADLTSEGNGGEGGNGGNSGRVISGSFTGLADGDIINMVIGAGGAGGVGSALEYPPSSDVRGKNGGNSSAQVGTTTPIISEGGVGGNGGRWPGSSNAFNARNSPIQDNNAQGGRGIGAGTGEAGQSGTTPSGACPSSGTGGAAGTGATRSGGGGGGGGGQFNNGGAGSAGEAAGSPATGIGGGGGGGVGGPGGTVPNNSGRVGLSGGAGAPGKIVLSWRI